MPNPEGINGVDSGRIINDLHARITQLEIDKAHFKRRAHSLEAHLRYVFNLRLPLGNTVADQMAAEEPLRHDQIAKLLCPRT